MISISRMMWHDIVVPIVLSLMSILVSIFYGKPELSFATAPFVCGVFSYFSFKSSFFTRLILLSFVPIFFHIYLQFLTYTTGVVLPGEKYVIIMISQFNFIAYGVSLFTMLVFMLCTVGRGLGSTRGFPKNWDPIANPAGMGMTFPNIALMVAFLLVYLVYFTFFAEVLVLPASGTILLPSAGTSPIADFLSVVLAPFLLGCVSAFFVRGHFIEKCFWLMLLPLFFVFYVFYTLLKFDSVPLGVALYVMVEYGAVVCGAVVGQSMRMIAYSVPEEIAVELRAHFSWGRRFETRGGSGVR